MSREAAQFSLKGLLIAVVVVSGWTALVTQLDSPFGFVLFVLSPAWIPISLGYSPTWVAKLVLIVAVATTIRSLAILGMGSLVPYASAWMTICAAMGVAASLNYHRGAEDQRHDRST